MILPLITIKVTIFFDRIKLPLLLIWILRSITLVQGECPSVCHQIACSTGVLSCPDGGLDRIPIFLPPGTSKILLTNHRFSDTNLQYSNLSNYGPPQFKVIKLTIQNCGLTSISPNTFSHLTDLSILDLANNNLMEIVPDTFLSLSLHFLRLDGNRNIILHRHSFHGAIITTLSLIDCSLPYILFDTVNEVSGSLKNLYLTNNKIKTIDRLFKDIFEQLTVIQINDNPINCTCDLQWLSAVLIWRRQRYSSTLIPGVSSEAQCQSPFINRHKLLIHLSSKDFNCHLPQLKMVDVNMISNMSARLTCMSEDRHDDHPTVQWVSKNHNKLSYVSQSAESAVLSVTGRSRIDNFLCIISNPNGNVTVLVTVQWPGLEINTSQHSPDPTTISFNTGNSSLDQSYFHQKRYTLLEMIGGVVGTFTFTMVVFLCVYRYMVASIKRKDKKKWYISYEPTAGSDSQTYDVPHCTTGPYYTGQLFSNHNSPARYTDFNGNILLSPTKTAAL